VHPECELASQCAHEYVIDLNELHTTLHAQLAEAQKHYQGPMDRRHSPAPDFKIGEQVFVRAEYINTTQPSKKLSEKYLGPFDIIARPGTHSITIHLPKHLHTIHPVFHVSQLELATPNQILNCTQPNLLHPWLKSTMSSNMKSLKSSTPKLTTKEDANSYTLSIGQGMKVLMKKPLGYQQPNSITHKNPLPISILITPEDPDLYKIKMTSKTITLKKSKKETKKNKDNYVAIPFLSLNTLF